MLHSVIHAIQFSSVQSLSCVGLFATPWTAAHCLPIHHQLLELTQTHVHQVGDAIQPSHPLSSPSPTFNLSQHQGLFKWVRSLHQVAKVRVSVLASVLPVNIQDWFPLRLTGWISLQSGELSVFSNATVRRHQFFSSLPSLWSSSHIHTWLLGRP